MSILCSLSFGALWSWIRRIGPFGLIVLGILDNAPFLSSPSGSVDVLVILACSASPARWAYYAVMASVGEILGGYLMYWIAQKGRQDFLEKKVGKKRAETVYGWFGEHGFLAVCGGAIAPPPFPYTSVLMAAGLLQYPWRKFLLGLVVGRSIRLFSEAFLARTYGSQMIAFFTTHYQAAMDALIALTVAAVVGALIYFKYFHKTPEQSEKQRSTEHLTE